MKRYVKEFLNDLLTQPISDTKKLKMQNIFNAYEKGLITRYEAIKTFITISEE